MPAAPVQGCPQAHRLVARAQGVPQPDGARDLGGYSIGGVKQEEAKEAKDANEVLGPNQLTSTEHGQFN